MAANGSKRAPKPADHQQEQPPAMPATARMNELLALRARGGGLVVAPPQSITLGSVRAWLTDVAALGSPGDVEIAWLRVQDRTIKMTLLQEYERLRAVSGQRHFQLEEAMRKEREQARAEWRQRSELANLRREIAADEKALAAKKQRLARLTA